jgi:hypothetical protein
MSVNASAKSCYIKLASSLYPYVFVLNGLYFRVSDSFILLNAISTIYLL